MGNSGQPTDFSGLRYVGFGGSSTTEADVQYLVPVSQTFTTLYCRQSVTGATLTVTVRINGTDTDTACTSSDTATQSVVGSYAVTAGDLVTVSVVHSSATQRSVYWALK
jgi:hypothetical protein